jgi:hypothetical protein
MGGGTVTDPTELRRVFGAFPSGVTAVAALRVSDKRNNRN